jgi:hypothetical protein
MRRTLILTTPMLTGDDVRFAQQVLKKHGAYDGEIDGEFGILSSQGSRQAQFELGYARPRAGFGTPLEKLLTHKATPTAAMKARSVRRKKEMANQKALRKRALAQMKALSGTTEHPPGSNHTIVGEFYGVQDEWCAMTVTMAYVKAGSRGFARGSRWAFVPSLVAAARSGEYGLTVTADPRPGDLVCYDFDNSNFATSDNHIGMFEKRTGPNEFQTIEGNVDDECKPMPRSMSSAPRIVFVRVSK